MSVEDASIRIQLQMFDLSIKRSCDCDWNGLTLEKKAYMHENNAPIR